MGIDMQIGGEHSGHAHEKSDVNVRVPAMVVIGLAVLTAVGMIVSWLVFDHYSARQRAAAKPASPLAATLPKEPPAPQLQVDPRLDLKKLRSEEEQILSSYGWMDKNTGVVRIPIDRAIQILAEKGLPARQQAETSQPDRARE